MSGRWCDTPRSSLQREARPIEAEEPLACAKERGPSLKTLTIHVGPHKTGTTSIQFYLHSNRRALAKQGVAYPSFYPPLPCHNQLALAFAEGDGGDS